MLFLDDVEKIVSLLGEISDKVEMRTDEYALDSPAELKNFSDKRYLTNLAIFSRNPYLYVDIDRKVARVYLGGNSPEAVRVFDRIRNILARRVAVRDRIFESPAIIGAIAGASLSLALVALTFNDTALAAGAATAFGFLILWDILNSYRIAHRTSRVWLMPSDGPGTFWAKHSERVFSIFIGIVAVLLVIIAVALRR
ncbi:MAG: hypothetical protein D6679_10225 [Candidatus Hydrogenedentota bacterium]|nr:MAG: hypothetical protein D6679_10225 [Candidatus Hydrogenedentota bacterium]